MGLVLLHVVGCQPTRRESALQTDYAAEDRTGQLDFWHGMADQPVVTHNDAFHGLIELAHGTDPSQTYEQRVEWLKEQGLLDRHFDRPADEAVSRGTVAQVLVGILDIEGGLTMRVIGPHPRYATRELVYLDLLPPSSEQQGMTGIGFVELISKAEEYQERHP
jgi:hypothetical protein